MNIYKFLGHFDNVKECACNAQGARQWSARCPAHSDRVNSLHIALSRDGKILLDCKAGCDTEDILRKVGLGMKDLFPEESRAQKPDTGRAVEVEVYKYKDIRNEVSLRKHRMRNPDGSKFFWWDRLENGSWQKGLNGLVPHLYGLDSVKEDRDVVVVVEGEKDVNTVLSFGSPCVTTPDGGGRKKHWQEAYDEAFRGKRVYFFPDNDKPGLDYARFIYNHVQDIAAEAFILNPKAVWPEMPEKGDISDMVNALGKDEALIRFTRLCDSADHNEQGFTLSPFLESDDSSSSLPQSSDADADDWALQLERYSMPPHAVKPTVDNFYRIMCNEPFYRGLRFNRMSNRAEIHENGEVRDWSDTDAARSHHFIEKTYSIYSPKKHDDAMRIVLREHEYNPLMDLISSVQWDGENRIEHLLTHVMKAEDTPYTREVSRLLIAGGIHRLVNPGCRFDEVPILTGDQMRGKSTFIEWLAVEKRFHGSTQNMTGDRDSIEKLSGCWIIEIPELTAIRGTSVEKVKAFVSTAEDRYRLPYDRNVSTLPRGCIFIGTDNNERFLTDKTGNRRFYPVAVRSTIVELTAHEAEYRAYILQCWAEGLARLREGTLPPYPNPELMEEFRRAQENAMEDDWREGAVDAYLRTLHPGTFICNRMVIDHLFPNESEQTKQKMSREIGQILSRSALLVKTDERRYLPAPYGRQRGWLVVDPCALDRCA